MSSKARALFKPLLLAGLCDGCFFLSSREHFGHKHPKYSDTLLDYGFYLLNVDNICQSVAIYQVNMSAAGNKSERVAKVRSSSLPFLCTHRRRWTSDSLCSAGRTSTSPPPTRTWPTLPTCTSTALGNSTTRCEYHQIVEA